MKVDLREVPVYWITVDKYPDRQVEMERTLKELEFKNVTKIVGKKTDHYIDGLADTYLECLDRDPPFIIFEDDARSTDHWAPILETHDCDAIYLGVSRWSCDRATKRGVNNSTLLEDYDHQYKRVLNMLSAHAILYLSKPYIQSIVAKIVDYKDRKIPYDCALALCQEKNNVLALNQPAFYQHDKTNCTKFLLDEFTRIREPVLSRQKDHNNYILHMCNVWVRGGVPLFIIDFVKAFKEFRHIVVCKTEMNIDETIKRDLSATGAEFYFIPSNSKLGTFRDIVESIDPFITILHNTKDEILEVNNTWADYYPQVIWNHGIYSDLYKLHKQTFFFASDWLKDTAIQHGLESKDLTTCHPSIDYDWYSSIKRLDDDKVRFGTAIARTDKFNTKADKLIKVWVDKNNSVASFNPLEKLTANLYGYYSSIDCLIYLQNSYESCSRMILEAFAAGISVIAMKNSGPEELITNAGESSGILIDSVDELSHAMETIVTNKSLFLPNVSGQSYCKDHGSYQSLRDTTLPVLLRKGFFVA